MKFNFTADKTTYPSKPTSVEAAKITQNLEPVVVDSIDGFVEDIQQGIS